MMSSRRWNATVGNLLRDRKSHQGSFRSACTALAATIGTGNITGVAAAVTAGGPGAVFWMWVSAFLGMATAYGETVLGIRYREKDQNGGWMAGPMMYLEKRLGCPRAAVLYGFFCIPAAFGMGSMVQANAISETVILCVAGSGTAAESGAENGASLTSLCFFTALESPGGYAVAVCVVLFTFSTVIAWYYMGRQAAEYLGGKISGKIPAVYTAGYLLAAFLGCLGAMETVWEISDIFNGLMAAPNLAALVMLAGEIHSPGENGVLRPPPGRS